MKAISLCSGYGGLTLAVERVFGCETVAYAEIEPAPAAVFARHWPDAEPLGDLTAVDWTAWHGVDVIEAGFPCQDLSYAGKGAGIREGTRSGLWYAIEDVVGVVRPRVVVLENVAAIVARRPGLDVVLAGLARLGFDAEWTCLRASDVGAPHRRLRWFLVARNTAGEGPQRRAGGRLQHAEPLPGRVAAPDASGQRHGRGQDAGEVGRPAGGDAGEARQRQRSRPVAGDRGRTDWGPYAPAVRRWEHTLGRTAPAPTDDRGRLSPRFVEWMMGLPDGWVTDTPGLSRAQQLKCLGNGVVPQQAEAAIAGLLEAGEVAA